MSSASYRSRAHSSLAGSPYSATYFVPPAPRHHSHLGFDGDRPAPPPGYPSAPRYSGHYARPAHAAQETAHPGGYAHGYPQPHAHARGDPNEWQRRKTSYKASGKKHQHHHHHHHHNTPRSHSLDALLRDIKRNTVRTLSSKRRLAVLLAALAVAKRQMTKK